VKSNRVLLLGALIVIGGVIISAPIQPVSAQTPAFGKIPVIRTQLILSPGQQPRPAPPARPARPSAAPRPAPTPAALPLAQVITEGNDQVLKQLTDLVKTIGDLSAKSDSLSAQVNSLTAGMNDQKAQLDDLRKQLADTEARLKEAVDRAAAKPFQGAEIGGVINNAIGAHMDQLLRSSWPNIAVPAALLLILATLLGTMIIGVPINALARRAPRPGISRSAAARAAALG
jgi:hypothetical protein